ncbi:MAG: S-layer homology domain-containing protein [Lachnospiraceae bacterium]|nr:S-layer homology domain-containing protein [Lachnospiraceae bacterium]
MKKRIFALLMALAMILAIVPGQVFADDIDIKPVDEETPPYIIGEEFQVLPSNAFNYVDEESADAIIKEAETYPSKYDLRDKGFVTSVKLQNPFGTCWAFAVAAAAESSLLSSGIAAQLGKTVDTLNVSERHLAYFAMSPILDMNNSQYGEGRYFGNGPASVQTKMNAGGVSAIATCFYSNTVGPVFEDSDPYFAYGNEDWDVDYRSTNNGFVKFGYSASNDWSIPETDEYKFSQDIVLKNSYVLPAPAGTPEGEDMGYEYNPAATAAIKKQLMEGRAVSVAFLADQSQPNQDIKELHYISENWAQYANVPNFANHAVCIVGWDDDYDVSNFLPNNQPPANGAWLVKNSWGSGEEEFPNTGDGQWGIPNDEGVNTGYFWISYYDMSLCEPETYEFMIQDEEDKTDLIDAYDFMPPAKYDSIERDEVIKCANVFHVASARELRDIGFMTTHPETTVKYTVYIMDDFNSIAEKGLKVAEGECVFEFGGFHRVSLENPVALMKNQFYSIVLEMTTSDGKHTACIPAAVKRESDGNGLLGVINDGECTIYYDGAWQDLYNREIQELFLPEDAKDDLACDNFPIKGYSKALDNEMTASVVGPAPLILCRNREVGFVGLRLSGKGELPAAEDIEWKVAEVGMNEIYQPKPGNEIVTIEPVAGSGNTKAKVTGLDEGSVYVYADIEGFGKAAYEITVYHTMMDGIELEDREYTAVYTGLPQTPVVNAYNLVGDKLIEGEEYRVEFENNIKVGVAMVKGYGLGLYVPENPEEFSITYFAIIPPKAEITGHDVSGNTLTVNLKDQSETGQTGYRVSYRPVGTTEWKYVNSETNEVKVDLAPGFEYEVKAEGWLKVEDPYEYYGLIEEEYVGEASEEETFTTDLILFKDVTDDTQFYYNYIYDLAGKGIVTGYEDGTFRPLAACSRAVTVTFLWNAAGRPEPSEMATFSDMTGDEDVDKAISWAVEKGITTGWDDNTFRPDRTINRAAVMTFLYRMAKVYDEDFEEPASVATFKDMTDNEEFNKAISWAVENDITTGWNDNTFRPWRTCNRLAITSFIARHLGY